MHTASLEEQVLERLREWLSNGDLAWLCTIVGVTGSSPRPVGSIMACNRAGVVAGSLSGGCVEDDLLQALATGRIASEHAEMRRYGLSAEENERLGLPCGGHMEVLVEPLRADRDLAHIETLIEALAARRCIRRSVDIGSGARRIDVAERMEGLRFADGVLVHTLGPRFRLLLIGAGQVAHDLALLATLLDYRVTVCDPRRQLLDNWRGAEVERVCAMPDDFLRDAGVDKLTAIVTLTHDPRIDDMALMEALTLDAFYIGALGSVRTSKTRRQRLQQLDLSAEQITRLHAPVGLDIGSKRPMEIAIAIMAELIALRRQDAAG